LLRLVLEPEPPPDQPGVPGALRHPV
jgi:hypothetical protein